MEAALRRDGAIHGAVYLTALTVALIAMSPLRWPWYLVLPLLAYLMIVVAWPRLRRTAPGLTLGHLHGYPPGPLGAVLAGIFGMALGLLRLWTGGVGLTILVHICAGGTIFTIF